MSLPVGRFPWASPSHLPRAPRSLEGGGDYTVLPAYLGSLVSRITLFPSLCSFLTRFTGLQGAGEGLVASRRGCQVVDRPVEGGPVPGVEGGHLLEHPGQALRRREVPEERGGAGVPGGQAGHRCRRLVEVQV